MEHSQGWYASPPPRGSSDCNFGQELGMEVFEPNADITHNKAANYPAPGALIMWKLISIAILGVCSHAALAQVRVAKPNVLSARDVLAMLNSPDLADQGLAKGIIWGVSMGDPKVCPGAVTGRYIIDTTGAALRELIQEEPQYGLREAYGTIEAAETILWPCK
jgi:hypothetical protein